MSVRPNSARSEFWIKGRRRYRRDKGEDERPEQEGNVRAWRVYERRRYRRDKGEDERPEQEGNRTVADERSEPEITRGEDERPQRGEAERAGQQGVRTSALGEQSEDGDDNERLAGKRKDRRDSRDVQQRGSYFQPLSWNIRMKVALDAAKGLAYLHSDEAKVIYRDFKASNILLDSGNNMPHTHRAHVQHRRAAIFYLKVYVPRSCKSIVICHTLDALSRLEIEELRALKEHTVHTWRNCPDEELVLSSMMDPDAHGWLPN
ncbi:hypothetical protein LR48_Vigan02g013000 [Vigna angularis]|uniref:Protein kinase domain-containing protein n=1 Tax=Phaseolus angularis TaxID=3914 RepID=A0A0L9TTX3_PHAAN|nr:hypothetical protein LR48_Vigan02g013000 [Vigna angularis]